MKDFRRRRVEEKKKEGGKEGRKEKRPTTREKGNKLRSAGTRENIGKTRVS